MKIDIHNRFSGEVQFTAEIDCDDSEPESWRMRLAVLWALDTKANLIGADLSGANLSGANLSRAYLSRADLSGANLSGANLSMAYLSRANLSRAYLSGADLSGAKLSGAKLNGADFSGAKLSGADLIGANLSGAKLSGADLNGADFSRASGVNEWVKCIHIDTWPIAYTADDLQIGCQRHSIEEWRAFDDAEIVRMDGRNALKFWRKYKNWIFQTIELCPAKPTKTEAPQ